MRDFRSRYADKFLPEEEIFARMRPASRIVVGTGCGQPRHLLNALLDFSEANPKAVFDSEMYVILVFGLEQYHAEKIERTFRQHCFSIRESSRSAVNRGAGDYNAVFLSNIPKFFRHRIIPVDVALVQTSLPDADGNLSLGISVDITRTAVDCASLVVAQVNAHMPFVRGDAVISPDRVDYFVHRDEPLYEFVYPPADETRRKIGANVAGLIDDGSTIHVGHGITAQSCIEHLAGKKHLGIHTELLSHGLVELIRCGAVDNSMKSFDAGKTVATVCTGDISTYEFLHDNPAVELRSADYTNNHGIISRHGNMVSVNGVLTVDLTGQVTAESIGRTFFSGLGGLADFARGAGLAEDGKSILALKSTARGGTVSRIVPFLESGEGVSLNRGDVQYVVTEYGVANLAGKNMRERAMSLIGIAHPSFRQWLVEEAKKHNLIYQDQIFYTGRSGEYPESLEAHRKTKYGIDLFLRPLKFNDEPLLKEFKYSLSERSIYNRFVSVKKELPHEELQKLVVIDYQKQMAILAVEKKGARETLIGIARYFVEDSDYVNFSIAVRDEWQNQGIGDMLLDYMISIALGRGFSGFTVDVLLENKAMIYLCRHAERAGHIIKKRFEGDMVQYHLTFREKAPGPRK